VDPETVAKGPRKTTTKMLQPVVIGGIAIAVREGIVMKKKRVSGAELGGGTIAGSDGKRRSTCSTMELEPEPGSQREIAKGARVATSMERITFHTVRGNLTTATNGPCHPARTNGTCRI
jgi:hypothetical protein